MQDSTAPAVYYIGSINVDFQVRAERWPTEAETLNATDFLRAPGGKAANRAFVARKLGVPAVLVGRVGDDDFGGEALEPLRRLDVNVAHVRVTKDEATGVAMIVVRPDGKKTILLASNANAYVEASDAMYVEDVISRAPPGSVVSLDLEVPSVVVAAALKAARARRLQVVLDPSPAACMQDAYYEQVDWLTPNHTEAQALTGVEITSRKRAEQAARKLETKGVPGVCVKLSDGGCVALVDGDMRYVATPEVAVVDKTGAGDAFAGALSTAVFERQAVPNALRFAVFTSTLATTCYGSQAAYPDRETLERQLAEVRG